MGRIVVSENVSLDGVIQDPAGVEGFSRGGWVGLIGGQGRDGAAKVAVDEALGAKALLLGRRSYEFLAARWPSRSGPFADRLNSFPKYVVSSTLDAPVWNNTTVIRGDVINKVSKLKREIDGDILVAASFQLWHTLMEHDLVDELHKRVPELGSASSARAVKRDLCASSAPGLSTISLFSSTSWSRLGHELLRHIDRSRR